VVSITIANVETDASLVSFRATDSTAVVRTAQDKMREWVSVKDFGAVGDGVTDDYAAIMAAIESAMQPRLAFQRVSPEVYFPMGKYRCTQTIQLKSSVKLRGDGSGQNNVYSTQLIFPAGVGGVVVHRADTFGAGSVAATYGGDCSVIEGLAFVGAAGAASALPDGIWLRARAVLRNCSFVGFQGNGIRIEANTGSAPYGNANNWRIDDCAAVNNVGHGLFVNGQDVNAGLCTALDVSSNAGWGMWDSSFLGNCYIGVHSAGNAGGSFKHDGGPTPYIGCYIEGGQPLAEFGQGALLIGGLMQTSDLDYTKLFAEFRNQVNSLNTNKPLRSTSSSGGVTISATIGAQNGGHNVQSFVHSVNAPHGFQTILGLSGTVMRVGYGTGNAGDTYLITGPNSAYHFGRGATQPYSFLTDKLFLGGAGANDARNVTCKSSVPASGTWARGDIVFNTSASAGGYVGWVCVTGGTPGTWKQFGAIEP